jgi:UDP-galactopyranose mutase
MMTSADYLIVGAGLTGSTIARMLHDQGREVLVLDRRHHVGGNVHDSLHPSRIRLHTYGPHYFRCSSRRVWEFVSRFSAFYHYEATVKSLVEGRYENWPVNRACFGQFAGWQNSRSTAVPANFEEACLQKMPRPVYETFVQGYTRRHWGVDPRHLHPGLAGRIRINIDYETTLTPRHFYQGLPTEGYHSLMTNMLEGIPCSLGVDYLENRSAYKARRALVFTGPIDEFFGFDAGRLGYRSLERVHEFLPGADWFQPCGQVNHPDARDHEALRTMEWKHLMPDYLQARLRGTLITGEFPFTPDDPDRFEYPVPTAAHAKLYRRYRRRARAVPGLIVCGRLGSYRYLDMDAAIGLAMRLADTLIHSKAACSIEPAMEASHREADLCSG